jgi:hypothetical protein
MHVRLKKKGTNKGFFYFFKSWGGGALSKKKLKKINNPSRGMTHPPT